MKKISGITYQQLINLTYEELNEIRAVDAYSTIIQTILDVSVLTKESVHSIVNEHLYKITNFLNSINDEEYYNNLRKLYSTEELFDLAFDIKSKSEIMPTFLFSLMHEIADKVNNYK